MQRTGMADRLTVDLMAKSVYLAARNLVFGFNLLPRTRIWASCSSDLPKLGLLPPVR
jgi:hypothetical protein